jgi:TonB family protein
MRAIVMFAVVLLSSAVYPAVYPTALAQDAANEPPPVRVGGNIPFPRQVKDVRPVYPPAAQQARVQGMVIVEATIGAGGKVRDAVVRRSIPLLDDAALTAVRQWEYTPTIVDGIAHPVIMTVTVNFALEPGLGAASSAQYGGGVLWLYSQRTSDGLMSYWEITPARGEALGPWNPRSGPPPLSIVDAIKAGETWLAQKSPDVKTFELASAALQRTQPYSGLGDRWFYRLDYDPVVAGRRLPGGSNFIVVVLLDGTVVEPRVDRPK